MYHGGGGGWHGPGHWGGGQHADLDESLGRIYDHRVVTRLAKYLLPHKWWVALAVVCMLAYTVAQSVVPLLIGMAIDRFIRGGDREGLTAIVLLFFFNALALWGAQAGQTVTLSWVGYGVLFRLRQQLFDHLQRLTLRFFDHNEVGIIMSRVQNDVLSLQELLTSGFISIFGDLLMLVLVIGIMVSMNPRLALITLSVVPFLGLIMVIWQSHAKTAFMRVRQAVALVYAGLQENISGVRVIQSLVREDVNVRLFDGVNASHLEANLHAGRLAATMMPVIELLMALATALIIVFGGAQVLGQQLLVGELVAFTLYVTRFFEPIRTLTMQYTELQRAMAGGSRIFELLDMEPDFADAPQAQALPPIQGEVCFHNVSFEYEKEVRVLHNIDLLLAPGETVALVGRTGAGKSTLASLLARFYDVAEGSITVDGYDIRQVTQGSLRQQMGIVPQDPFLFSGTVEDNIRYGRLEATSEEVVAAAKAVEAHDFIQRLELGYQTPVQERGLNLSTGQRQLIAFARAIIADPHIIILDEATANVDTQTEAVIQRALRQLLRGRTALVIAHRLSTVREADRIVVLEQGRIVEEGNHTGLLARGGLYAQLYNMQLERGSPTPQATSQASGRRAYQE